MTTAQPDGQNIAYRIFEGPDGRLFVEGHNGEQEPLPVVVMQFEQGGDELKFVGCRIEDV